MKLFFCLDCDRPVDVTVHGYCPYCGSEKSVTNNIGTNLEVLKRSMRVAEAKELYAIGR